MDFTFTAEQDVLRGTIRSLAEDHTAFDRVRRTAGFDPEMWAVVAGQLGLPGVALAERHGGAGGSWVEAGIVFEEAGRALLPVPLLATMTAAAAIERAGGALADELLPELATGRRIAAVCVGRGLTGDSGPGGMTLEGRLDQVVDAESADLLVAVADLAGEPSLVAIETDQPAVERIPLATLDPTRRQASVVLHGAGGSRLGGAEAADVATGLLRVALAVEAIGGARRCLEMTLDYLRRRVQFGQPIGSFQALQHRAADLAVQLEAAASTGYYASWAAAAEPAQLNLVGPLAKAVCCDAFFHIAAESIQLHGGIGFTWEHEAHLYFKRATTSRLLLGDSRAQRRAVAIAAGLGVASGPG
ncbi:MAG TPA: acyl-CoA dehydrogenase family protein [Mycobacteriales bacterium]|nr:acyl-CoA dehydrogenase family protein [Mycobacteriales bacterium]